MSTIDINADVSEGLGNWILGDDAALFPLVSSVNAGCGWHAGDPSLMRDAARLSQQHGTALGAHPGFPDLMGFGRRMMDVTHDEVIDMVTYQVGAMMAIATQENVRLSHVKAHGKLYAQIAADLELGIKFAEAMLTLQDDLIIFMLAGEPADNLKRHGLACAAESIADLDYTDDGTVIIERRPRWRDPALVAHAAVRQANGFIDTIGGKVFEAEIETVCIHGDRPGVVDNARAIQSALAEAGFAVAPPTV